MAHASAPGLQELIGAMARWLGVLIFMGVSGLHPTTAVADDLAPPPALAVPALELLATTDATRDLRTTLDSNRISITFVPLPAGMYARYSMARHAIEIDERWQNADSATLAAVIAHESTHAQDAVSGALASGGAAACIDSEVRAFRNAAHFWTAIHGPNGKAQPADDLERQLNLVAERENRDPAGLEALVRQAYTEQCSS